MSDERRKLVEAVLCSDEYVSDWEDLNMRLDSLGDYVRDLDMRVDLLVEALARMEKRIGRIEQFLRALYQEKWDSFEANEKVG